MLELAADGSLILMIPNDVETSVRNAELSIQICLTGVTSNLEGPILI